MWRLRKLMSNPLAQPVEVGNAGNGNAAQPEQGAPSPAAEPFGAQAPPFPALDGAEYAAPQLHAPAAMTLVRDRWERLVSTVVVPSPPEEVWRALTDPAALKLWLAVCHGSLGETRRDCVLDFEDGEFFLCRATEVEAPNHLRYLWRWLGIGQATSVSWRIEAVEEGARVTVTEEARNPPWDWQTWNGGGWPGILDQLAAYLRTGMEWRWPWRRMGPYAQVELPSPVYEVWDRLFSPQGLKYWLLAAQGVIAPGQTLPIFMGDASGIVELNVGEVVQPGQSPPSFLPHVTFSLRRQAWGAEVGGRLWIEPAGWGRSILQVFHYNWESLPAGLQLSERRLVAAFWAGAMRRAQQLYLMQQSSSAPHNW